MSTGSDRHTVKYRIMNYDLADPEREIEVHATPQEIAGLVEDGFMVRERFFDDERVERFREALATIAANEREKLGASNSRRFGGLYLRYLMDKHEVFLELLKYQPTLSIARAVLGPQVRVRGMSARICYPDELEQETSWHFHHRVIPQPLPPFFSAPHALDFLFYLDDVNETTGQVCLLPGSHRRMFDPLKADDFDDKEGQVVLSLKAGSCVVIHSNLWHRALPMQPSAPKRRMMILSYTPTWMRTSPYGERPESDRLTDRLLAEGDPETLELLGVSGYT